MPIFEYRCSKCNKIVEVIVKNSEEKSNCPHCGNPLTDRVLSTCNSVTSSGSSGYSSSACPSGSCCPDGLCNLK